MIQFLVPLALSYAALVAFFFVTIPLDLNTLVRSLAGGGVLAVVLALIQDVVPKPLKEAVVFFRLKDRLPGHRCFMLKNDQPARFKRTKIKNIAVLAEADGAAQQIEFYSIYKKVSQEKSVEHYSIRYLAWRDSAATAILLAAFTMPVLGLYTGKIFAAGQVGLIMFLIGVLCSLAARQSANELVLQVLAIHTTR